MLPVYLRWNWHFIFSASDCWYNSAPLSSLCNYFYPLLPFPHLQCQRSENGKQHQSLIMKIVLIPMICRLDVRKFHSAATNKVRDTFIVINSLSAFMFISTGYMKCFLVFILLTICSWKKHVYKFSDFFRNIQSNVYFFKQLESRSFNLFTGKYLTFSEYKEQQWGNKRKKFEC